MVINNYFNQLRQMFESDLPQDAEQTVNTSGQNTNNQNVEADWKGFTTEVDNFINQVSPLKEFFQSFVNTNSSRTDENGKNALNLANKYLNEAVDIEQTLNKAKQTISASTANELQTLKNAMDEAEKALKEADVNLKEKNKTDNQPKEPNPGEKPEDKGNSSNETDETSKQNNDKPKQNGTDQQNNA